MSKNQIILHPADVEIMIHKVYGTKYKDIKKVSIRRDRIVVTFEDPETPNRGIVSGILSKYAPPEMANLTTEQIYEKIKNPCSIFDRMAKDPVADEHYEEIARDILKNIPKKES